MEGTRDVSASYHAPGGHLQPVFPRREPAAPLLRPDGPPSVLLWWTGINETDYTLRLAQCALNLGCGRKPVGLRSRREVRWDRVWPLGTHRPPSATHLVHPPLS